MVKYHDDFCMKESGFLRQQWTKAATATKGAAELRIFLGRSFEPRKRLASLVDSALKLSQFQRPSP